MVVVTLAPSTGAAVGGLALSAGIGIGAARQQDKENAQQDERIRIAQESLKLAQARSKGAAQERALASQQNKARLRLDEMRRRGVATPQDIQQQAGQLAGQAPASPLMGPAVLGVAQARARKQQEALDKVFPNLSPSDRQRLLGEYQAAEQEGAQVRFASAVGNRLRDVYRSKDIAADEDRNLALDPHIDAIERFEQDPSRENFQAVQSADQFLTQFLQEEGRDRNRQVIADQFHDRVMEAVTPSMPESDLKEALDLEWQVRTGEITKDEGEGRLFTLTNPRAANYAARQSAEAKAEERYTQKSDNAVSFLLREKSLDGEGNEIPVWVRKGRQKVEGQFYIDGPEWDRAHNDLVAGFVTPGVKTLPMDDSFQPYGDASEPRTGAAPNAAPTPESPSGPAPARSEKAALAQEAKDVGIPTNEIAALGRAGKLEEAIAAKKAERDKPKMSDSLKAGAAAREEFDG